MQQDGGPIGRPQSIDHSGLAQHPSNQAADNHHQLDIVRAFLAHFVRFPIASRQLEYCRDADRGEFLLSRHGMPTGSENDDVSASDGLMPITGFAPPLSVLRIARLVRAKMQDAPCH